MSYQDAIYKRIRAKLKLHLEIREISEMTEILTEKTDINVVSANKMNALVDVIMYLVIGSKRECHENMN